MAQADALQEITPDHAFSLRAYWTDFWNFRELLVFFTWRDLVVRYRQTVIGVAWALIKPMSMMLVFSFVFGRIARLPDAGVPYPLLVFAGVVPWQFFASALGNTSESVVGNGHLMTKIYFPRIIVPVSALLVAIIDFLLAFALFIVMLAWYRIAPTANILALPVVMLPAIGTALGAGLWFAALNVRYRDFRHIVMFVVQFGAYVSPVGFLSSAVPESWQVACAMNPLTGVIDGFRWAMFPGVPFPGFSLGVAMIVSIVLLVGGFRFFVAREATFVDDI